MPQTYLSVTLLLAVCTGAMAANMMEVDPEVLESACLSSHTLTFPRMLTSLQVKGYFDAMDDNKVLVAQSSPLVPLLGWC